MDEYKSVKKMLDKNNSIKENHLFTKILILIILFFVALIAYKENSSFKKFMDNKVFGENFKFASFKKMYNDTIGKVIPFVPTEEVVQPVFNEKISYSKIETFLDGFELNVGDNYLVPIIESGIVVFIGEKEGYGNTIIIQQVNGVDTWYSNIDSSNIKLYDYVTKGDFLGESKNDKIYLTFQKEGEFLDYKEFI